MNATQNNNVPYIIIIILLIIIAVLAFFVGKSQNGGTTSSTSTSEELTVTVIDDKRCTDCNTLATLDQLKAIPGLANATFEVKDFSDKGSDEILKETGLNRLPAFIFEHNKVGDLELAKYLVATKDEKYYLNIGSKFNPYAKRSERGFLLLDEGVLANIKKDSYINGNSDALITWIEYSDVECPFCAKLHNDGTPKKIMDEYGKDLNKIFQHFPLDFHPQAQKGAEALECIAAQKSDVFYKVIEESYKKYNNNNFSLEGLYDIAAEKGVNKKKLKECVESGKYADKVTAQMNLGKEIFSVTGTPGNILINSQTGEYEILSGAYPFEQFKTIIDKLK